MRRLKIIFMGTPEFAVASLDALYNGNHDVVAVVTVADKPAGRGQRVHISAVKKYALEKSIPVLQPLKLKDEAFLEELRNLCADIFVIVAFRMLPEVVWNMPPLGSVNLHASLLPKYRGAAPINWAIINGEKKSGVTVFFLQNEIDTGRVLQQKVIPIGENETAGELHDRMMEIGADTLFDAVNRIAKGETSAVEQNEMMRADEIMPHAPKIFKEDCRINWEKPVDAIHNFVRGMSPYPAAWTMLGDKTLKIYTGEKLKGNAASETWSTDGKTYLHFKCADGSYAITDLQLEGKKRMQIEEFLRGWRPPVA